MYKLFFFNVKYVLLHSIKIDKALPIVHLTSNYQELIIIQQLGQAKNYLNISLKIL